MMIFRKVHLHLEKPEGLHVYWTADFSPQGIRISSELEFDCGDRSQSVAVRLRSAPAAVQYTIRPTCLPCYLQTMDHKGWHSRGYLPHCDFSDSIQGITFRLADSVPIEVIAGWKKQLKDDGIHGRLAETELYRKTSKYEDAGYGDCILRRAECAEIVQAQLKKHHGERYRLLEWCIMPNHVHVLIAMMEGQPLGKIVQAWKGGSSVEINRILKRTGTIWAPDYHDRYIRDQNHLIDARIYIRMNPVKARFCGKPEEWAFSSAGNGWKP